MADWRADTRTQQQGASAPASQQAKPGFQSRSLGESGAAGGPVASPPVSGTAPVRSGTRSGIIAVVVAVAVVAAMATSWFTAAPKPTGDAALTSAQQTARAEAFTSRGPVTFDAVPAAEQSQAISLMALTESQRTALVQDLQRPDTRLVYITLWDDYAEDGDVVSLESSGFTRTVSLTNAPQRFAVPITAGRIVVRGVRDGRGGITMGAQAEGGPILVPVIAPGEAVDVPVALP